MDVPPHKLCLSKMNNDTTSSMDRPWLRYNGGTAHISSILSSHSLVDLYCKSAEDLPSLQAVLYKVSFPVVRVTILLLWIVKTKSAPTLYTSRCVRSKIGDSDRTRTVASFRRSRVEGFRAKKPRSQIPKPLSRIQSRSCHHKNHLFKGATRLLGDYPS